MERDALEENEFHHADVLVEAELGLMVALRSSTLAPDIRGTLIIAIDPGSASESIRRFSGYLDLARATPPMQAGAPVSSTGDGAARLLAARDFEIEPRLWSELNGLAQSNSSVVRGYAL